MTAEPAVPPGSAPQASLELDFWLSGQFRMRHHGEIRNLGNTVQHQILAILVLHANSAVAVSDILGSVWPAPGQAGEETLRPYISRIRRMLAGLDCRLTTLPRRYLLEIDPMRVDVLRFNALVEEAGTGDMERRRACLEAALDVCRTDALLSGFTRSWVRSARDEHRARWCDAAVRRNRFWLDDGAFLDLLDLMRRDQMHRSSDQRLAVNYIDALRGSGQLAEAIEYYDAVLARLRSERVPIHRSLRQAGEHLARSDPLLDPARASTAATTAPDMLPPHTVVLEGRGGTFREIERHAADRHAVRVVGIYGPPGIGKTSVATGYARQYGHEYPGGVLFAQVGFGTEPVRADIDGVLESFLRALGVAGDHIPADRTAKVHRYRELTRHRAMLVVLDNVGSADELGHLLPAGPGSLALVTSRRRLVELTARFGARPIVLQPINDSASVSLLTRLAGSRPDFSATAAMDIAKGCGGHPLALSLAGARLATRPEEPLASVVAALAEPGRRMEELGRWGDSDAAVTEVIRWSYGALEEPAARVFRLLGLSPCATLDLPSLAALVGRPEAEVAPLARSLVATGLVSEAGPQRYRMLDIVAEYARGRAVLFDPREVAAALDRLYGHQREAARAAAHALWPEEVVAASQPYHVDDKSTARAWLDDHRDDLLLSAGHPSAASWPEHVIDLAHSLFRYLDHGGYLSQAIALHEAAVVAAQRLGDERARAWALGRLGAILVRRGDQDRAGLVLREARDLCASLSDARGEAVAWGNLGRLAYWREAFDEALQCHREALRLFREVGDPLARVRTHTNLALVHKRLGRPGDALRALEEARVLLDGLDAPDARARVDGTIAGILRMQGRLEESERHYQSSIDEFRRLGDRIGEATSLTRLGQVRSDQGRYAEAVPLHEDALKIFTDGGDERGAVDALFGLGSAVRALGQRLTAVRSHREALDRAAAVGNEGQLAAAHSALAEDYAMLAAQSDAESVDTLALARTHLAEAVYRYGKLGSPPPAVLRLAEQLAES